MSRASNLNELEQFFFDSNYNSLPLPTLASKLNRTEKFLAKLIERKRSEAVQRDPVSPQPPSDEPPQPKKSTMANTQFNLTLGRRRNADGSFQKDGPIVMTEGASMVGDEALKKNKEGYISPRLAQGIFRMREE